ncbi:MAG: nucleotidyltransferase domain-containing protein [Clostridiales bacterium]|jgi:predicted nucleotidyltransferase|nr:nucleotidyltransferase domain-containing protein [Clostridiales bacterium]
MVENDITIVLEKYIQKVVPYLDPREIILFGSQVRGNTHKDSDIDVAIILDYFDDSKGNFLEVSTELVTMRRDIDLRIEPHLLEANIDRSGFLAHVRHTGRVIYSRAA